MTTLVSELEIIVPQAEVAVRPAREADISAIVAIVAENARQGHLLPLSLIHI